MKQSCPEASWNQTCPLGGGISHNVLGVAEVGGRAKRERARITKLIRILCLVKGSGVPPICPKRRCGARPSFLFPGAFPHEGRNEGEAGMFPESREGPSTGGRLDGRGAEWLPACYAKSPRVP